MKKRYVILFVMMFILTFTNVFAENISPTRQQTFVLDGYKEKLNIFTIDTIDYISSSELNKILHYDESYKTKNYILLKNSQTKKILYIDFINSIVKIDNKNIKLTKPIIKKSNQYFIPFKSFFTTLNCNINRKDDILYISKNPSSILFRVDNFPLFSNNFNSHEEFDSVNVYYKNFTINIDPQTEFISGMILAYKDIPVKDQYLIELKNLFMPYRDEPIFKQITNLDPPTELIINMDIFNQKNVNDFYTLNQQLIDLNNRIHFENFFNSHRKYYENRIKIYLNKCENIILDFENLIKFCNMNNDRKICITLSNPLDHFGGQMTSNNINCFVFTNIYNNNDFCAEESVLCHEVLHGFHKSSKDLSSEFSFFRDKSARFISYYQHAAKKEFILDEYVNMTFELFIYTKTVNDNDVLNRYNKRYSPLVSDLYNYMLELEKENPNITVQEAAPFINKKAIELVKN